MHPVGEQRVVNLAHAHAGALLHAFDCGFGRESGIDRLIDPPGPAFVIGEHLVCLEHLLVLTADPEFGLARHAVDLLAHLVECQEDTLPLGLGVLGHNMLDGDPRLVENGCAAGQSLDQLQPGQPLRPTQRRRESVDVVLVDQAGVLDQLRQDHGHGLQRLDLDLFVAAGIDMLDAKHARRTLTPDNRHPGEGMIFFLAGFRAIREIRVGRGFGKVERFDIAGDDTDKAFTQRHARHVHRALFKPAGGEEFEHAFAQQVY